MKLPPAHRCVSILCMQLRLAIAALLLVTCPAFARQSQKQPPQPPHKPQNQAAASDHLGMTCAQILAISSSDWIAKFVATDNSTVDAKLRGIRSYGECYDARTDQLAAALARKGIGPKKAALANLKDFQAALDSFTSKALTDEAQPAQPVKAAYAALYAKQFRYAFYQSYEPPHETKSQKPAPPAKKPNPAPSQNTQALPPQPAKSSPSPAPAADSANLPPAPAPQKEPLAGVPQKLPVPGEDDPFAPPPAPVPSAEPAPTPTPEKAPPKELDPFTKEKNHFGELLGQLPEDKMHEVHSAFGKLFGGNPVSEDLKFEVYGYAIFLLEKPSEEPYAPPPF
jgi:hypothetical protein